MRLLRATTSRPALSLQRTALSCTVQHSSLQLVRVSTLPLDGTVRLACTALILLLPGVQARKKRKSSNSRAVSCCWALKHTTDAIHRLLFKYLILIPWTGAFHGPWLLHTKNAASLPLSSPSPPRLRVLGSGPQSIAPLWVAASLNA